MKTRQFKPLRPGQTQLLAELPEVLRQLPEGGLWRRRDAPTTTGPMTGCPSSTFDGYDIIRAFEMMANGEINGYICQGFNPLQAFPDQGQDPPRRSAS